MLARIGAALVLTVVTAAFAAEPVSAETETYYQRQLCAGMSVDFRFPDGTRPDCISHSHVLELDFSEKWAEAVGQALHYHLWGQEVQWLTGGTRRGGIVLICRNEHRDTCTEHVARASRIIQTFDLPLSLWDCDEHEMTLPECQRVIE